MPSCLRVSSPQKSHRVILKYSNVTKTLCSLPYFFLAKWDSGYLIISASPKTMQTYLKITFKLSCTNSTALLYISPRGRFWRGHLQIVVGLDDIQICKEGIPIERNQNTNIKWKSKSSFCSSVCFFRSAHSKKEKVIFRVPNS